MELLLVQSRWRWPIAATRGRGGPPSLLSSQTTSIRASTPNRRGQCLVGGGADSSRSGRWERRQAVDEAAEHVEPWRLLGDQSTLDLTEENVRRVLGEARVELAQIFDDSVGITGEAELVEVDGPFVIISLRGRFWHKRSTVLDRLSNFLRKRIPEILQVDLEDDKQLDDSPENF